MTHDEEASKATAAKALLGWGSSKKASTLPYRPISKSELNRQELDIARENAKSQKSMQQQIPNSAKETHNVSSHHSIQNTSAAVASTTRPLQSNLGPHNKTLSATNQSRDDATQMMEIEQLPHLHPQQHQQHQLHHHLINANSLLSMTSIGFGIDSSPSAALGDATDAALKAVQDAMERSSLRLPISSPAHSLLQIKVKLGVPARQDGSKEPMNVHVARLSSFLPSVIPVLPIDVQVGGLFLPSAQGSPSICTAVAIITLQSQTTALPLSQPSSPALTASHPASAAAPPSHTERMGPPHNMHSTRQPPRQRQQQPVHAAVQDVPDIAAQVPVTSPTAPSQVPPSLQHLNHLATAAAASPPVSKFLTAGSSSQPHRDVHRTNSMEMLAMISEQIRNKSAENTQQISSASSSAASIGAGLATAALQGVQKQAIDSANVAENKCSDNGRLFAAPKLRGEGGNVENPCMNNGIANSNYKKLPPGVTTKNNQRLFVKHRYRDFSTEKPRRWEADTNSSLDPKGTIKLTAPAFPVKLHETLSVIERDGYSDIIGWLPHGRSFKIHKQKEFTEIILPRYFIMTKKSSFLRQLNLYSFRRLSAGPDQGSYYHELFLRGFKFLTRRMQRQKINGQKIRSAGNPDEEPILARYPVCPPPVISHSPEGIATTADPVALLELKNPSSIRKLEKNEIIENGGESRSSEENYELSRDVKL